MTQPATLREQLKALEHLQELDTKIDRLKKDKSALPIALKALDDAVARVRQTHDSKKNIITEIEKVQSQTKAALDLNRDRLARSSTRLEAVQNTNEFQAASKEIEQLRKLNSSLEEQSKRSATEIDTGQNSLTDLNAQLEKAKGERDQKAETINGQASKFDKEIAALMTERAKYTATVEKRMLTLYDRVRGARAGIGISAALGGRCKVCNMMVPAQLYNEVQRGTNMQACPSCGRILYIPATDAPSAEGAAAPHAGS